MNRTHTYSHSFFSSNRLGLGEEYRVQDNDKLYQTCSNTISNRLITIYYLPTFYSARYTFSGKERDEETGYSYFGARYYNSSYSIWLSVDPMSDKYPNMSPYVYCGNNPVRITDPRGQEWDIDGFRYMPGQNCPDNASESTINKWNTMNEIYKTKNGKIVIDALNGENCLYSVSSDVKTAGAGGFSHEDKAIYLNGHDKQIGTLAHEMFHAYQDYYDRYDASIFNEVEANLFSFAVQTQHYGRMLDPSLSALVKDPPTDNSSKEYKTYYGNVSSLFAGSFTREKFNNVVSGFLQHSRQNANGTYNKYKQGTDIYDKTLIERFYP